MKAERKKEIKERAKEINRVSEQYQLIHATHACQEVIQDSIQKYYEQKLGDLKKEIEAKFLKNQETSELLKKKERLEKLLKNKNFTINVGYIKISNPSYRRATKVGMDFGIYLAASLRDSILNEDGSFNYKVIIEVIWNSLREKESRGSQETLAVSFGCW